MIDLKFTAEFVAGFEGFVGHVYLDAVGVETIGYGETRRDVIERYRQSGISQPDALDLLERRVQEFADAVEACITNAAALTPNRHAALTSFAYNVGVAGFKGSTACKRFNAGDIGGVPEAIGWWDKAGGQVLPGLARRRAAECALFQRDGGPVPDQPPAQAPGGGGSGSDPSVLREGDRGERVREAQRRLGNCGWALTADGIFGGATADAVCAFQRRNGLSADGIVGPATWQRLSPTPPPGPGPATAPTFPGRALGRGVGGDDVYEAQRRLKERGWAIVVDGLFGPRTDALVRAYQTEKALIVDGVVGPVTWLALWTAPVTGA